MATPLTVNVSGSLLSSLFYEHVNSPTDQEGFLLGEIVSRITDTISDSQMRGEKEETCLNIYGLLPCGDVFSFYDVKGHIKEPQFEEILQKRHKEVVGWYRFRRNSILDVSMREQIVHKNLARILASSYEKFFVFGLFTCSVSSNEATHSNDHVFYRLHRDRYEPLQLKVINLGDMSHMDYRLYSPGAVSLHSGHFGDVLRSTSSFGTGYDAPISQVQQVHTALQQKLEILQEQVGESEAIVAAVSLEVEELVAKLNSIQQLQGTLNAEPEEMESDSPSSSDKSEAFQEPDGSGGSVV